MSGGTWKARFAAVPFSKKLIVILNIVLVVLCAVCVLSLRSLSTAFDTVTAAHRFQGDSGIRFAQIACYLPVGEGQSQEEIWSLREKLDAKLVEQSLEAPEEGNLYLDAYSARTNVTVKTAHSTAEVSAYGVGGEFFYFHPMFLRSGSYISERDLMDDLVVLDEALAWRFFGGIDLAGMTLYINDKPFVVSGVISMEDDIATGHARTEDGILFLSYPALAKLQEGLTIDSYEIVMPNPISGYALGVMEELMGRNGGTIVENSGRFSFLRLWDVVKRLGERSMRMGAVVYPYWENALRFAEDHAALLAVLITLTALCPCISLAIAIVRGVVTLWRFIRKKVPERLREAMERSREERYARLETSDREGE